MSNERFGIGGVVDDGVWTATPIYLDSLVDTVVDSPTDGFVLTYETSSSKWKAKSIAHVLDSAVHTISGKTVGQYLRADTATTFSFQARTFTISATIKVPDVGYTIVWRAPFDCTCTKLEGRQKGGTSTVINARYNGTTDVATVDLILTAAETWYDTTGINQTAWSATDWLEIEVQTLGGATEITLVLTFTEP